MSKRRRSDASRPARDAQGGPRDSRARDRDAPPGAGDRQPRDPGPAPRDRRAGGIRRDVLVLVAAFGVGVGLAELFGAANLGVAFGVGQVVFVIVLVVLLTRG